MFSLASDQWVDIMVFWVLLGVLNEEQIVLVLIGPLFSLTDGPLAPFIPPVEIYRSHEYSKY